MCPTYGCSFVSISIYSVYRVRWGFGLDKHNTLKEKVMLKKISSCDFMNKEMNKYIETLIYA